MLINTENNEDYLYNTTTSKLLMYVDLRFYTDITFDEFSELYKSIHRGKRPKAEHIIFKTSAYAHELHIRTPIYVIPLNDVMDKIMLFDMESSSKVKDRAIAYIKNLKYLFINKPVKEIGNGAFYCCDNLEGVYIADSVTTIGDYAFGVCRNLKYIELSNNIKYIGKDAFKGCNKLYIRGHKNSVAESYAKEYDIEFVDIDNIFDLKDYLLKMGAPKEKLNEINIKINKGCKYGIKDVIEESDSLMIITDKNKYLLDKQTNELFMYIDLNEVNSINTTSQVGDISTDPYSTAHLRKISLQ